MNKNNLNGSKWKYQIYWAYLISIRLLSTLLYFYNQIASSSNIIPRMVLLPIL